MPNNYLDCSLFPKFTSLLVKYSKKNETKGWRTDPQSCPVLIWISLAGRPRISQWSDRWRWISLARQSTGRAPPRPWRDRPRIPAAPPRSWWLSSGLPGSPAKQNIHSFHMALVIYRIISVADPWKFGADPDPATFVSDLQDINKKLFLLIPFWSTVLLHNFSKIKSHKEVTKQ